VAGIYIHIPFCRRKCHYCNFFSQASVRLHEPLFEALLAESRLAAGYLAEEPVDTIYFGGGTPSLLSPGKIRRLVNELEAHFRLGEDPEITLEVNPDDLNPAYIKELRLTPVNRISVGVQSFNDTDLLALNRVHTARQSLDAIKAMQDAGFNNLTLDLIYGIPGLTDERWVQNLETAIGLGVQHISAYALTVEEHTALSWMISHKKAPPVSEEQSARQYDILVKHMREAGFVHYEISNFCTPGHESRHNSNYWKGVPYLGLGPSAHSYNRISRRWNISNISSYIESVSNQTIPFTQEILTDDQQYNEFVMTGLRTMWGVSLEEIRARFGNPRADHFAKQITRYLQNGMVVKAGNVFTLTEEGMFFADGITAGVFA
jgi:oxygen-independent coproporphyrinogen III oxidase